MIRQLLLFYVLRRPVFLTDWLEAPVELKHWAFEKLNWSARVHEVCPHFCPCGVDLGLDEDAERAA